jgi:hypothetical protein
MNANVLALTAKKSAAAVMQTTLAVKIAYAVKKNNSYK